MQRHVEQFILRRVAHAVPELQVLACLPDGPKACQIHLRDSRTQTELYLPVSHQWVKRWTEDCSLECDCSQAESHDCPLRLAARIFGLHRDRH